MSPTAKAATKLGSVAPIPQDGGSSRSHLLDPPARPGRGQPLVRTKSHDPGRDHCPGRQAGAPKTSSASYERPASSQSARSTAKSGTKNEPSRKRNDWKLVSASASAPSVPIAVVATIRQPLRRCGEEVLQRDGARVGVRERLVRLGDREHEEREQRDDRRPPRRPPAARLHRRRRGSAGSRRRGRGAARRAGGSRSPFPRRRRAAVRAKRV